MAYQLGPNYELGEQQRRRMSLEREPFISEPETLFDVPAWQVKFQLLHHLILYSNVLMVLVGKQGTGKTSFLNQFVDEVPQNFVCHKIDASSELTPKGLQQRMVQVFSLSSLKSVAYNDVIGGYIKQIRDRKRYCVLIIDNAHLLSKDVMELLYYYIERQDSGGYLQFILAGDYSLERTIEQDFPDKLDEFTHVFEIPVMNHKETASYLEHRLSDAGFKESFPFDEEAVMRIYSQSLGNISRLNLLAQKAFYEIYFDEAPKSLNVPSIAKAGALAVVLLLLFIYLIPSSKSPMVETRSVRLPAGEKKAQHKKRFLGWQRKNVQQKQFIPFSYIPSLQDAHGWKRNILPKTKKIKVSLRRPVYSKVNRLSKSKSKLKRASAEPSLARQLSALKASRRSRMSNDHVLLDSVVVLPKLKKSNQRKVAPQAPKGAIAKRNIRLSKNRTSRYSLNKKKSLTNRFVIQLMASSQIDAVEAFAKEHKLRSKARFYQTKRHGKNWYVVVIGNYISKEVADRAVRRLPRKLQSLKPWVRSSNQLSYISRRNRR